MKSCCLAALNFCCLMVVALWSARCFGLLFLDL